MNKVLAQLRPGQSGRVSGIGAESGIRLRLFEMGMTPGTIVQLIRVAPLGDPLELRIRGYHLSLRRAEAAVVGIEAT